MDHKSPLSHDVTRTTFQVLSIGLLIGAVLWILRPFLASLVWATMIVVATWPVLLTLRGRLGGRRGLAVVVMTVLLLLVIVVPLSLIITAIVERADKAVSWVKSLTTFNVPPPPEWLSGIPLVGQKLAGEWQEIAALQPEELSAGLAPYVRQGIRWFVAQIGNMGMMALHFLLTVIIAAILYANGEAASGWTIGFARRLAGSQGEDAMFLAAKAVRGVALGVVVTAIAQASVGGLGLAVTGVPAAMWLTAVMFVLCLAQVGPFLVLAPAVIWLFWKEGALWGSVLLIFTVVAGTLDNFLRPILIRKGADLPLILIFAGVIGGLIAFGVIGLFIGPVLLAVSYTLLNSWVSDSERGEAPATEGE